MSLGPVAGIVGDEVPGAGVVAPFGCWLPRGFAGAGVDDGAGAADLFGVL
jgi:hypothetical protein